MRPLFVVQRYGTEVAGGAEQCCREFASRLARRGHEVEVLTSCAVSYVDWANSYPPGTDLVEGVLVHRLAVRRPRETRLFAPIHQRVVSGRKPVPFHLQREWMRMQGPDVPGLAPWLEAHACDYDVVVFFTYLYETTFVGLPVAAHLRPTLLHPTAHDEPPLYLDLFDIVFRVPDALGFLTEEEQELVERRFHLSRPSCVTGVGVEVDRPGDDKAFRAAFGVGERPYLLFVGRVDPHKGSQELYEYFLAYKRRNRSDLALVVLGEEVSELSPHPDVFLTGFVDEPTRRGALTGALAAVVPSYFESFSMVLTEAWAERKAALVQGRCAVLAGQARRSGGAIPYEGFAEFEVAVDAIVADRALARALGEAGRRYVEKRYQWDDVLDRYERQLQLVMDSRLAG
jgi:glycosyltransferase involved in cell wall biosynthesis